ncbi:ribosome silencing factor RsfS [Pseudoscardovia radai]|jgi:ribosome-associated protein|uniref:Ribosomal silencing factor RsfS n=1 Tax=Pseudoscardovia radai TaxID=987066 RepID=A0A261F0S7_9BIFI|nr:ribosome silencing factor [Pseudoscardovia radai]OZG52685.1 ribosome silencing factor RsfS [Pseudoscardovia radai]
MAAVQDSIDAVRIAAAAADSEKAEDMVAFDVSEPLAITDIFFLATGTSPRHVLAIAEEIEKQLYLATKRDPRQREGIEEGEWVLLDYGDFVVHVMDAEARAFYDIERLWKDCPRIDLQLPDTASVLKEPEGTGAAADDADDDAADDAESSDEQ